MWGREGPLFVFGYLVTMDVVAVSLTTTGSNNYGKSLFNFSGAVSHQRR